MIFFITVTLIATAVFFFSGSYIRLEVEEKTFHYILFIFVLSMICLIIRPNLISALLGWDGLGISSYLLVLYYGRAKSHNSGILTAVSNRVGDGLIIVALGGLFFVPRLNFYN